MTATSCNSWVISPKTNPNARLRLFCFPYAGCGASIFRPWVDNFPAAIEVCLVQLPGRESRLQETLFTRLGALLPTLAEAIHPYLNMPFAFFGHSMGALIAFELARQLGRQYNLSPVHLFVSGRRAPQLPNLKSPIHQLPQAGLIEELRALDGTPQTVLQNPDLMRLVLPIIRADFALCETYVYSSEALLDCPISAFGGWQDKEASPSALAAWRNQTNNCFVLRMFSGNHFFLHAARLPIVSAVSQDLRQLCIS